MKKEIYSILQVICLLSLLVVVVICFIEFSVSALASALILLCCNLLIFLSRQLSQKKNQI